jgi:phenylacetate-CoA ligase
LTFSARIRQGGFWALDRLKGAPIRKHCEDIEEKLASGSSSTNQLEELLHHAVGHTEFYGACRGWQTLQDFPIINKSTLKSRHQAFLSDAFQREQLHAMHTSGSTGTPLEVLQDPDKRRRALAEMICFGRRANYHVGDRFVFTRVWNSFNRKSRQVALRENAIMFDISSLDDQRMDALRTLLGTDPGIRCMLGYPSTFGALLRRLEHHGDSPETFHLRSIISISEQLPQSTRKALQARFGCTVVSRYSNQENGVLAQQCPGQDEFHLNTASYAFEFLQLEEDRPANPGDRARLVVTDLYNRAMPLIRYDTGDIVTRQAHAACGEPTNTLREVEGRRVDFIRDIEGRLLSPYFVCNHFWAYTKLKQFQFVQESPEDYQIILNGGHGQYPDEEFIALAKRFLGQDARVTVAHVDQIPLISSGKFKLVVNRCEPLA